MKDPRADAITIQQLLTHTSGIAHELDYDWNTPEDDDEALERFVRRQVGEQLIAAPGEWFSYSNIAFEVLGDVVAKMSGRPFETYVETQILDPLEMHAMGWEEAVGFSWFRGVYRGRDVFHHGGSDPGFSSEIVLLPDADAAVVVLANANTAATRTVTDAALDVVLGVEPQRPKVPVTVPIGATLAADGPEAAIAQYRRLSSRPDQYDADPDRFLDATWGAIEMDRAGAVLPLVQLWVTLEPEAALAHEMLGWAYLTQGATELAAGHLRRALALDPESWHAALLLEQLSR